MGEPTEEQVRIALSRVRPGLTKYLWLQRQVRLCDVTANEEFQRTFCSFYRVRRDSQWQSKYFALLESSKLGGIDFPRALQEINLRCGKIEASFASKLVATLDPSKPVIDKFVLNYFGLQLPRWGSPDREARTIELYFELSEKYRALMQSSTGTLIRNLFDASYPKVEVNELKKIDFVLWQLGRN